MTSITDASMHEMLGRTRPYSVVILSAGPRRDDPDAPAIIWEHGRRNFALRAAGTLCIVCPVTDGSAVAGVGVFNADAAEAARIMDDDPAVKAGIILVYDVHPCRSFPGDALPG